MFGSATLLIMTPPCLHSLHGCFVQAMSTFMVNGWRTGPQGGRPVPVLLDAETGAPLQPEDIPLCLGRFNISHTPSSVAELSSVARIAKVITALRLLPGEAEKGGFDTQIVSHAILQSPQPPPPGEKRPAPGVILITADGDLHECPLIYTCWDAPQQQPPPPPPQQQQ